MLLARANALLLFRKGELGLRFINTKAKVHKVAEIRIGRTAIYAKKAKLNVDTSFASSTIIKDDVNAELATKPSSAEEVKKPSKRVRKVKILTPKTKESSSKDSSMKSDEQDDLEDESEGVSASPSTSSKSRRSKKPAVEKVKKEKKVTIPRYTHGHLDQVVDIHHQPCLAFTVYGKPAPLPRHRVSRFRMYNPAATIQAEFYNICKPYLPATPLTGPIEVMLTFIFNHPKTQRRGKSEVLRDGYTSWYDSITDVDNLAKFVLDVLNKRAFLDDKQIVMLSCSKVYTSKDDPQDIQRDGQAVKVRIRSVREEDAIVRGNFIETATKGGAATTTAAVVPTVKASNMTGIVFIDCGTS